jgi:hypothetical protein
MDDAVVEHGMPLPIVEGFGLGVGTTSNGLTPALPISTEPNGIPARGRPPGDADDVAADDEALLLELVPHIPEVAAPPGNVPVPTPSPPPSKFVLEPDIPNDGLPMTKHVVPFPVIPMVPAGAPLSPGDASSVAPMGIPVGGTGEPAAMPSGEVAPIPGGRAAHPANLCERRDAAEERCLHRGNQYASHHDLHCSGAAIRPARQP